MARFWTRESVALLLVAVLASASAYEAAVALEWISLGSAPGEAPSGEGFVRMIAIVGMLVGAGYCASVALRARSSVWPDPLIPVAAAGVVIARFYSFDPYYLPTLRRFSVAGGVADWWVYLVLACALVAAALVRVRPRVGLPAAALLLPFAQ